MYAFRADMLAPVDPYGSSSNHCFNKKVYKIAILLTPAHGIFVGSDVVRQARELAVPAFHLTNFGHVPALKDKRKKKKRVQHQETPLGFSTLESIDPIIFDHPQPKTKTKHHSNWIEISLAIRYRQIP